jgi:hypothetical protein
MNGAIVSTERVLTNLTPDCIKSLFSNFVKGMIFFKTKEIIRKYILIYPELAVKVQPPVVFLSLPELVVLWVAW